MRIEALQSASAYRRGQRVGEANSLSVNYLPIEGGFHRE
jgi:hypothetical protein